MINSNLPTFVTANRPSIWHWVALVALLSALPLRAQTWYVTLSTTNNNPALFSVQTNYLITCVGSSLVGSVGLGYTAQGSFSMNVNHVHTGLSSIGVAGGGVVGSPRVATFSITCPAPSSPAVFNYIPADAIVIPSSATGPVQVILESSPDLVNWTAAQPGTYGPSAGTNRFFRVRAIAQ